MSVAQLTRSKFGFLSRLAIIAGVATPHTKSASTAGAKTQRREPPFFTQSSVVKFTDDLASLLLTDRPEVAATCTVRLDLEVIIEESQQGSTTESVLALLTSAPGASRHKAQ